MSFERRLVLNRWLHSRFGASSTDDLLDRFARNQAPPSGESPFLRLLLESDDVAVEEERLRRYDDRILDYQARLAAHRPDFSWKPFQYLALLYSELLLDEMTDDPDALVRELNRFLAEAQGVDPALVGCSQFTRPDLRRMAFFMATGSGKTLVMHANLWQVLHYLEQGARPDALVDRPDGRAEFDNVLLVTPTETLSRQHITELRASGVAASHLAYDADASGWLFEPPVRVIEIHKLAEQVSGEGLSIALEALGPHNLVFVDEGHKGRGSEAQTWKNRQRRISEGGLLVEYSATFAQAVASVPRSRRKQLEFEYGKSIVFDYSYRHFHDDGYGKHFEVLNLRAQEQERAHELLVGALLTYYQQLDLFASGGPALREFNIERPLWVFLGSSVIKSARRDLADVAIVVDFLRRFIEDREWAVSWIGRVLSGDAGFRGEESNDDLFAQRLEHLRGMEPEELYERVRDRMFHGGGALEVWELKNADGELGLRVSGGADGGAPYFGVINVGDARGLARHLEAELGLETLADEISGSLFDEVDARDSPIHVLVGSRKFIEGWSSWRVSSMGLLNMGRGEGPQVIQLFGRGVRLKGRHMSLQRTTHRSGAEQDDELPTGLRHLETLYISGWNADYIQAFRRMLEEEELAWEEELPLDLLDPQIALFVPKPRPGYDVSRETWTLDVEPGTAVRLDRVPRVQAMRDGAVVHLAAVEAASIDFSNPDVAGRLDVDRLYADLLRYKQSRGSRGYGNVFIRRSALMPILETSELMTPAGASRQPDRLQRYALDLLQAHLDRFLARREKEAESRQLEPRPLEVKERTAPYLVRGSSMALRDDVRRLIADRARLAQNSDEVLPRLHLEWHLFSPLLLDPRAGSEAAEPRISPPGLKGGELRFLRDLVEHWGSMHLQERNAGLSLYLLRNLPHRGVGFFRRMGFYPDFLLWLVRPGSPTRLRFVEPHGMHHEGVVGLGNLNRIEALKQLERISRQRAFRDAGIEMAGWIVTETERSKIPGAESLTDRELASKHRVLRRSDGYIRSILDS